jgi:hypothetical protein
LFLELKLKARGIVRGQDRAAHYFERSKLIMALHNEMDGSHDADDRETRENERFIEDRDNPNAVWVYRDEIRNLSFTVLKGDNHLGEKAYAEGRIVLADGFSEVYNPGEMRQEEGWVLGGATLMRRVPYMMPELMAAPLNQPVMIVEGEKDVDALRAIGFTATCMAGGARQEQYDWGMALAGRDLIIIPDNDGKGRYRAIRILESVKLLIGAAAPKGLRVADLGKLWTVCPKNGDMPDFLSTKAASLGLQAEWEAITFICGAKKTGGQKMRMGSVYLACALDDERQQKRMLAQTLEADNSFEIRWLPFDVRRNDGWKEVARELIAGSTAVLALTSDESLSCDYFNWELECALTFRKRVLGIWAYKEDRPEIDGIVSKTWTSQNITDFLSTIGVG